MHRAGRRSCSVNAIPAVAKYVKTFCQETKRPDEYNYESLEEPGQTNRGNADLKVKVRSRESEEQQGRCRIQRHAEEYHDMVEQVRSILRK